MRQLIALSGLLALCLSVATPAHAVPLEFTNQGRIKDALGAPLNGFNSVSFSLHTAPAGGSAVWAETQTLDFTDGYFSAQLGSVSPLNPDTFDGSDLFLSIAVNGGTPIPERIELDSVPYAFRALNAETATNVDGGIVDASEVRINGTTVIDSNGPMVNWSDISGIPSDFADGIDNEGSSALPSCGPDQMIRFNGTTWSCVDEGSHDHSAAQITGGTLSVDRIPLGATAGTVAAGDHLHPQYSDSSHTHSPSGVNALSCSDGQVAKWDSGAWQCDNDGGGGGGGGLLLSFDFEESVGTTFADTSGGGNDATTTGAGVSAGASGHSGQAIAFLGGVLQVPDGNSVADTPSVTLDTWVKPTFPLSGTHTVAERAGAWKLDQVDDQMVFTVDAVGGSCTVASAAFLNAGAWNHVTATYNGAHVRISIADTWVDGVCEEGPITATSGGAIDLGEDAAGATPFDGSIDEFRLYGFALDQGRGLNGIIGGTINDISGWRTHTWLEDGSFTTPVPLTIDVLVVAGGGAGGSYHTTNGNGGGGGGGVIHKESYSIPAGAYDVRVGDGGGGIQWLASNSGHNNRVGNQGEDSAFGTLVAFGGGGGSGQASGAGRAGGSGGGASQSHPGGAATQTGTDGHGFPGGQSGYAWTGGGGGGAGGPGVAGNACGNCAPSGNGGPGYCTDITGTNKCYAGGGGGGGNSSERAGDGFHGGGRGYGTTSHYEYRHWPDEINATTGGHSTMDGIDGTGGGGGGGSYWAPNIWIYQGSGSGGSGVVVVRYPI